MAVDADDVTHIAVGSLENAGLLYYTVDTDGVSAREVVDPLGWSQGTANGIPALVALDNDLYVFSADVAHYQLLYSLNRDGIWLVENEVIPADTLCMDTLGAGYLANANLLYVVYQETFDEKCYAVTWTPGLTNYQTNEICPNLMELPAFDDDETNLGVLFRTTAMFGGDNLVFSLGPPRTAPHAEEIVTNESSLAGSPYKLEYNTFQQTWLAGSHDQDLNSCVIHTRTPEGYWTGPQLVTSQPGTAWAAIGGIEHDHAMGFNYVVVYEQPDGESYRSINVYADNNATGTFEYINFVMEYDTDNYDMSEVVTAPSATGWPFICLMIKPNTQTTWNFRVLAPATSLSWNSAFTWETEYIWISGHPTMTVLGNGLPALALIEELSDSDYYGRVLVRYPW